MGKYNYYGIKDGFTWHMPTEYRHHKYWLPKMFAHSDVVWCQGPFGGVRVVHQNFGASIAEGRFRKIGYITTNTKEMEEFTWVKLKAKTISTDIS